MQGILRSISIFVFFYIISASISLAGGMYFIENRGQWEKDILFRAEIPGGYLFLKSQSLIYVLYDAKEISALHGKRSNVSAAARDISSAPLTVAAHGVEVQFQNSLSSAKHLPRKEIPTFFNYFFGKEGFQNF